MHSPYDSGDVWEDDYYEDFVEFVGQVVDSWWLPQLPFNKSVVDVLTERSSPQNATLPLESASNSVWKHFLTTH